MLDQLLSEITPKDQEKVAIKMRVAVRIGDALSQRAMQKKELAAACELKGASMVTKWLSGGHNFTLDTLVDIAHALGMTVSDLVRPAEQRVIASRTVTVQVAAAASERRSGAAIEGAAFVGRSSSATKSTLLVSEPVYRYGQDQPCLA